MTLPLFNTGQSVSFTQTRLFLAPGAYRVVSALPATDGRVQYRVKSNDEAFDRIVDESNLEALNEA